MEEIISLDDLKDVFYSGYSGAISWDCIDELYIAIHKKELMYARYVVTSIDRYHELIDSEMITEGPGPQKAGHMALKTIAKEWLNFQYGTIAKSETYFAGLHPDVISTDRRYVIECGTTDPGCIRIYLAQATVLWAGNIPYPFAEENSLTLHAFHRGPQFHNWQEDKVNRLREVFRKHR